jgi:hypothetical protein
MASLNIDQWTPEDVAQWIKGMGIQKIVAKYLFNLSKTNRIFDTDQSLNWSRKC